MSQDAHRPKPKQNTQPHGTNPATGKPHEPVEIPVPKRGDVDKLLRRAAKGLSTAKSRPAKSKPKSKPPAWKSLPDDQLAAYLLGHPTLPDSSWSDRAGRHSRRKGEGREAFIRRVLLGEEAAA